MQRVARQHTQHLPLQVCTAVVSVQSRFFPRCVIVDTRLTTFVILCQLTLAPVKTFECVLLIRRSVVSNAMRRSSTYLLEQDIRNGICFRHADLVSYVRVGQNQGRKAMWDTTRTLLVKCVEKCSNIGHVFLFICTVMDSLQIHGRYYNHNLFSMLVKNSLVCHIYQTQKDTGTVKTVILAAFNFCRSVYSIILVPLILAFLLAELSNTIKIRDL